MRTNTFALIEKKNSKKGMRISVAVHVVIILLALYPFLTFESTPDLAKPKFIEVQFTDFKSSSAKSSAGVKKEKLDAEEKVKETEEPVVEETIPEPVVEETKPEPVVEPTPEPAPQRPPVLTSNDRTPPVVTSPEKPKTKVERPKRKPVVLNRPDPKPSTPTKPKRKPAKKKTKPGKAADKSDAKQDGEKNNSNSGGGEAPENGKDATSGKTDSGSSVGDFPGDGLFNRKVIYRADVKSVTKEEGKIVINLCVNREGRVVYTKYNKETSTIDSPDVLRKALEVAQDYRFEKDYTAPDKQCGKLTFIFEIEEE